jgi:hypothetical protein
MQADHRGLGEGVEPIPKGGQEKILIFFPEPVFLNVYGAQESIPRNEFRQPI